MGRGGGVVGAEGGFLGMVAWVVKLAFVTWCCSWDWYVLLWFVSCGFQLVLVNSIMIITRRIIGSG